MFSFLNFLKSITDAINRRKGLLFTLLFFISVSGIAVSMYFVDRVATTSSNDIYQKLRDDMVAYFENTLEVKKNNGLTAASMLAVNIDPTAPSLATDLLESTARLEQKLQEKSRICVYSDSGNELAKSWESENEVELKEEQIVMLKESDMISDLDIKSDGIYITSIVNSDSNGSRALIEYQQDIANIKSDFSASGRDYIFLLKKTWMAALSAEERVNYRQLSDSYMVRIDAYDDTFLLNLNALDIDELKEEGFILNEHYFTVADVVKNFAGETIGLVVIGEKVESAGSIVVIAQKIVNSITTIAIGLVTSIILLMF
jgi:hypothetical protein